MKLQRNKGFTLIEVLIASVILFSALAITAELYSASSLSAKKATQRAHVYQINTIALTSIKAKIARLAENRQLAEFSDEFTLFGVVYSWHATREKFESRVISPDDVTPPRPQFGLFNVNISAQYADQKPYEFTATVATW